MKVKFERKISLCTHISIKKNNNNLKIKTECFLKKTQKGFQTSCYALTLQKFQFLIIL